MILLFDTSTPTGYLALGDGTVVLAGATWQAEQSHSRQLPPAIQGAFQKSGFAAADLTHIAVGIGPGSFTGLRVALATAKGLGISLGIPIMAIPSLKLFAAGCRATLPKIVATSDAFRGEIYLGIYERVNFGTGHRSYKQLSEPLSMTPENAIEVLRQLEPPFAIMGTGYTRYADLFTNALGSQQAASMTDPDLAGMLEVAADYVRESHFSDPAAILPAYVRHAEAVEKRKKI